MIRNLTVDDGLPTNHVYSVIEDSQGFLWFATAKGVVKWDGSVMKVFTTANGLPKNDVYDLKEDSRGRIWVMSIADRQVYIKDDEVHQTFTDEDRFYMIDFYEMEEGIFFQSYSKLIVEKNDTLFSFNKEQLISNSVFITGHYIYTSNTLDSVLILNPILGNNKMQKFRVSGLNSRKFYYKTGSEIFQYLPHENNLLCVNALQDTFFKKRINIPNANKYFLSKIRYIDGYYYLCHNNSLILINDSFETSPIDLNYFDDNDLISSFLLVDKFLIVSTFNNGVYIFDNFSNILYTNSSFIGVNQISKSVGCHDSIWIGDINGNLFLLNNELLELAQIQNNEMRYNGQINYLKYDDKTKEVIYTSYQGAKKIKVIPPFVPKPYVNRDLLKISNNVYFKNHVMFSHYVTFFGDGWLSATSDQFFRFDFKKNVIDYKKLLNAKRILSILEFSRDEFIIGSNRLCIKYTLSKNNVDTLFNKYNVTVIEKKDESSFFLGTDGQGVHEYNIKSRKLISVLPEVSVNCMKSSFDKLLIGTNEGIYLLDNIFPYNIQYSQNVHTGLISNEIIDIQIFNNDILVSTNKGIQLIKDNKPEIPLVKIYLSNNQFHKDSLVLLENRNLNINIGTINYSSIPLDFQIYLTHDNGHVDTLDTKDITFQNLEPGNHLLRIYAENKLLDIKSNEIIKTIIIPFKYYETTWFKWLMGLLFLGLGYSLFKWREKRIRIKIDKENQIRQEIANIEFTALQSQLNPHFIFNALNSIQNLTALQKFEEANLYLSKFSMLMRAFLDHSTRHLVPLKEDLKVVKMYLDLEKLRFKDKLDYKIQIGENVFMETAIPSVMIQPIVENAIRHGIFHSTNAGLIQINIKNVEERLLIQIIDNGIGFEKSAQINSRTKINHQSKGLKILKRKTELLKIVENIDVELSIHERRSKHNELGAQVNLIIHTE